MNLCHSCSRLMKEYREMLASRPSLPGFSSSSSSPPAHASSRPAAQEAIVYHPVSETNLYKWHSFILGPPETPFAHHRFKLDISIPSSYPHVPPVVVFATPVAHPNVHPRTGEICLDILKDAWSPIWNIQSVSRAIIALLASGDAESPLNCDAGNLIRAGDWRGYWNLARMWTIEFAQRVEEDSPELLSASAWKKLRSEANASAANKRKS